MSHTQQVLKEQHSYEIMFVTLVQIFDPQALIANIPPDWKSLYK